MRTLAHDMDVASRLVDTLGPDTLASVSVAGNTHTRQIQVHFCDPVYALMWRARLALVPDQQHETFETFRGEVDGVPLVVFGPAPVLAEVTS